MGIRELWISTEKGHIVSATRFCGSNKLKKTIVISSATGVLQRYYKKFASHFSSLGFVVYTFDYHGIGKSESQIAGLKANSSNLRSWGSNDQAAVTKYAKEREKDNELILIAHSIGGQVLGFNKQYKAIDKIVLVASQTGYWNYFKGWHCPKMWLLWHLIIPVLTPLFGYFPSKTLGLFENLPKKWSMNGPNGAGTERILWAITTNKTIFSTRSACPSYPIVSPKTLLPPRKRSIG